MPLNYQCEPCGLHWPFSQAFAICPHCRRRTITSQVGEPMTRHQATFEAFYAKHDKDRKGPSPEAIGLREAQEILDLEHAMRNITIRDE